MSIHSLIEAASPKHFDPVKATASGSLKGDSLFSWTNVKYREKELRADFYTLLTVEHPRQQHPLLHPARQPAAGDAPHRRRPQEEGGRQGQGPRRAARPGRAQGTRAGARRAEGARTRRAEGPGALKDGAKRFV